MSPLSTPTVSFIRSKVYGIGSIVGYVELTDNPRQAKHVSSIP